MVLRLTNTQSGKQEEVRPGNPDGILRLYHCGPTVYGTPHLGNLRRFLFADLLVRTARFLGYRVRSVMNITDVGHLLDPEHAAGGQDRILVAAQREGQTPAQIAARYTAEFHAALAALRAEPADYFPRATMHIPKMQELIAALLQKGLAYQTPAGVYLDVKKAPAYGKLSGNTPEKIQAGARVEIREEKRHPADFALWILAPKEHLMQWDSPWGRGYPGWHIECSAMSQQLLGPTIDIHTGGRDNIFPHHENEIAQSEGATGQPFVRVWAHNEFLELGDGKMSKSAGGTLTLPDLTERGADPLAFRLLSLQTHYRSKLNFSWEAMEGAGAALRSLRDFVRRLPLTADRTKDTEQDAIRPLLAGLEQRFTEAIADDLGSPQALAAVFDFVRDLNPRLEAGDVGAEDREAVQATLRKLDTVLALLDVDAPLPSPKIPGEVQRLVAEREAARKRQDSAAADRRRGEIRAAGYSVEDTPTGPRVAPLGK